MKSIFYDNGYFRSNLGKYTITEYKTAYSEGYMRSTESFAFLLMGE